ncbi:indole-3-glycerol phosphate synthase TrpC [soil metagenome]
MNRSARVSSVLDRIVETKRRELESLRPRRRAIEAAAAAAPAPSDFATALRAGPAVAVIAEVKRRSPSSGDILTGASAVEVAKSYSRAGASAISVLTDREHFGGDLGDLSDVHGAVAVPLLRKDFTIDELHIHEARGAGASAVLLIARLLDDVELRAFGDLTAALGMSALMEVHDEVEVERALAAGARIIGVNNRDLATFETDLHTTLRLAAVVPVDCVLVAESGIRTVRDVELLAAAGADAVLVGEALMRAADPAAHLRALAGVQRRSR